MKQGSRFAAILIVIMMIAIVAPRPFGRVLTPDANAQLLPLPTPTIPPIGGTPTPTPPPPSPSPSPTVPGDTGGGNTGGGDDGGTTGTPGGGGDTGPGGKGGNGGGTKPGDIGLEVPDYTRVDGAYTTDILQAVATRLRALGWSREDVISQVYPPFIIAGKANWIDSWGFPRFGPGPIIRTHEGQDVFCEYGTPVLATENGIVDFDEGELGGLIARLHRPDGSYWYYAHLSDWNTAEFRTGDKVKAGDVLGYCGNSGNAVGGPAHVHFGWYDADGQAKNPMRHLIKWLRAAEQHAIRLAQTAAHKKVRMQDIFTAAHRFGDGFSPSLASFDISSDPLLASGTTPASGAFALAEAAVQAALSESALKRDAGSSETPEASSSAGAAGSKRDRSIKISPHESGD